MIMRAIAYSGLPDWRNALRRVAARMPARRVMIDAICREAADLERHSAGGDQARHDGQAEAPRSRSNPFGKEEKKVNTTVTFAGSQDLLDTLWGYYFATGSHMPIKRIEEMLPWSKSRDTIDKLTVGSMARYTLASYAVRDASLREFLRSELSRQKESIRAPLAEVVEAADTVQIGALRRDAVAAVEELKTKGSDARRNLDFWGQVGVGAVALGCVSAAALGQVAIGIPCVIGGSASQGLLSFWQRTAAIAGAGRPPGQGRFAPAGDRRPRPQLCPRQVPPCKIRVWSCCGVPLKSLKDMLRRERPRARTWGKCPK